MSRPGDPPGDVEPHEFGAPLGVCLNVVHPLAYLAFGPVRALAAELDIEIEWLPFPAAPLKPPAEADLESADRGSRHRVARARYQVSEIARYAEAQGLTLREPLRQADPLPSCLGHLWLSRHAPDRVVAFLETSFRGHWGGDMDVSGLAAVSRVVGELTGGSKGSRQDFEQFAAGPGPDQLAELRARLVAAGVFTVPTLVVENEVFVGRAHLPTVRWRLGGRRGPAPV